LVLYLILEKKRERKERTAAATNTHTVSAIAQEKERCAHITVKFFSVCMS